MRRILALVFILSLIFLSGCGSLTFNPEDLYSLPELSTKYTELSRMLNNILNNGAEYAPPISGTNIQTVQLVDLDGDGREEALAFFRNSNDEKPLKIFIFTADGDTYRLFGQIEGSGTSIYNVVYNDLNNDGGQEIAVSWKATAELQVLEIYSFNISKHEEPHLLVRTDYVKYITADLTGDDRQDLVVLRAGNDGDSIADYYSWQDDGKLMSHSPAKISATMAELSQQGLVHSGILRDGKAAIFVTGVTDQFMAVTDILTLHSDKLVNIALSEATGVSMIIAPFVSLYPIDINNDGMTEVPRPIPFPAEWEESTYRLIEWLSYDDTGNGTVITQTYHNLDDGWYLYLPKEWKEQVYVNRIVSAGETAVTFYIRGTSPSDLHPFLRICVLTGSGREIRATRDKRFILARQSETATIYTAELLEENNNGLYEMTEEDVREAFSPIVREWLSGDT